MKTKIILFFEIGVRKVGFIVQNQALYILKGARKSIGGEQNLNKQFENQVFEVAQGTMLYVGSDGFQDQNDLQRKPFGTQKLQKLLLQIAQLDLAQQQTILEENLHKHMTDTEQRDDVLLLGFRV